MAAGRVGAHFILLGCIGARGRAVLEEGIPGGRALLSDHLAWSSLLAAPEEASEQCGAVGVWLMGQ